MIWRWICKLVGHRWVREPYHRLRVCARCNANNFRQLAIAQRAERKLDIAAKVDDSLFNLMLERDDLDDLKDIH